MIVGTLGIVDRTNGRGQREFLLGRKYAGAKIGAGTISAPGGDQEPGETLLECLVREIEEEVGVVIDPAQVEEIAIITFFDDGEPRYQMHCFACHSDAVSGMPHDTKTMQDVDWYRANRLPFDRMLKDTRHWFSKLVAGDYFDAHVRHTAADDSHHIDFLPFSG